LFTVKDGLILIEALTDSPNMRALGGVNDQFVFADVNGDDWFYFEDQSIDYDDDLTAEQCAKKMADSPFTVRTISGSDTTLINFSYDKTPRHKVLHEGRCNFAGLRDTSSSTLGDPDARSRRFRHQEV
jgi:hypothetical protein